MNENNIPEKNEKEQKPKQSLAAELFDYLEVLIIAAVAVLLVFTFDVRLCRVDGDSMFDTLEDGQLLIVSDLFYTPEHHDIVVFHQSDNPNTSLNKPLVKRVIATEGEYYKIVYTYVKGENAGYYKMSVYVSEDEIFDESDLTDESFIDFAAAASRGNASYYTYKCEPLPDGDYLMTGKVPEGSVFVMGDNRYNSNDSRLGVGFVDTRCILGKVIFRVTPPGTVK